MTLTEQMKADGWIEHDGSECPIRGLVAIPVVVRAGIWGVVLPQAIGWKWGEAASPLGEIIAYRPEQPQ